MLRDQPTNYNINNLSMNYNFHKLNTLFCFYFPGRFIVYYIVPVTISIILHYSWFGKIHCLG